MTEVICLFCGDKIPSSTDRRNICTAATQKVAAIWKIFFRIGLEQCNKVELFDTMFTDNGEVVTANKGYQKNICRNCYNAFDRFLTSQEVSIIKI